MDDRTFQCLCVLHPEYVGAVQTATIEEANQYLQITSWKMDASFPVQGSCLVKCLELEVPLERYDEARRDKAGVEAQSGQFLSILNSRLHWDVLRPRVNLGTTKGHCFHFCKQKHNNTKTNARQKLKLEVSINWFRFPLKHGRRNLESTFSRDWRKTCKKGNEQEWTLIGGSEKRRTKKKRKKKKKKKKKKKLNQLTSLLCRGKCAIVLRQGKRKRVVSYMHDTGKLCKTQCCPPKHVC